MGAPSSHPRLASVDKFSKVWYNKNSVANIFSFADMRKKYRITYNSEVENAFIVHTPDRPLKFKQLPNGLYSLNPKKEAPSEGSFIQVTIY
jgi:hypothetical protein